MSVELRDSFFEKDNIVELETDNPYALREWENQRWFLDPNHLRVIQQLELEKKTNLTLQVSVVEESQNRLARYLVEDGAQTLGHLRRLFGRVKEIWMLDMGLGACHGDFEVISENEYEKALLYAEDEELMDEKVIEISDKRREQ